MLKAFIMIDLKFVDFCLILFLVYFLKDFLTTRANYIKYRLVTDILQNIRNLSVLIKNN